MSVTASTSTSTTSTTTTVTAGLDGTNIDVSTNLLLGPLPYNRFLGNPPKDRTPDECFKEEMGYEWIATLDTQAFRSKVDQLNAQVTKLQAEVSQAPAPVPASKK